MKKQQGFTIIELVVVILLLSILAATALPRLIDVTDEAHEAAVQGVYGGFGTGVSLFRAQWMAGGQVNTAMPEFNNLYPNSSGYPIGTAATFSAAALDSASDCIDVFAGVLQNAGLPAMSATNGYTDLDFTGDDDVHYEYAVHEDAPSCQYAYVGRYKTDSEAENIPVIVYDSDSGEITLSDLDTITSL